MKNLNKSEKLKFFKETAVKYDLTAYRIAQATQISERGILNILDGSVQNPHSSTVERLYDYVAEFVAELKQNSSVRKSEVSYERHSFELTKDDLTAEGIIAKKVISRLEPWITKNAEAMEAIQNTLLSNAFEISEIKVQIEELTLLIQEIKTKLDDMHEVVVTKGSR